MKKILLLTITCCQIALASYGQNATGSATQSVSMQTGSLLEIYFPVNSSYTGPTVTLPFTTATHYTNGVESATQQLALISNKNFVVTVKAAASHFSVTNNGSSSTSTMPVSGVLAVKVTTNNTGGSIVSPFSGYTSLTSSPQTLINNGTAGYYNKYFSVKYKATPGFSYSAGTYAVDIIYTATHL